MITRLPYADDKPRSQDHIFISYSSQDRSWVEHLAKDLRWRGHVVWIDFEGIRGGDEWRQSIANGLYYSRTVLLVCTPDSFASEWVEDEMRLALEFDKTIIPLWLRPVNTIHQPHVTWVAENLQRIDFSKEYERPLT